MDSVPRECMILISLINQFLEGSVCQICSQLQMLSLLCLCDFIQSLYVYTEGQNLCSFKLLSVSCLHSEGLKASEHGMPGLMCVFASAGVGYSTPHTSARLPLTTTKDSGKQVSQIRAFPVVLKPGSGLQRPLFSCPSQSLSLMPTHTHTHAQLKI